MSRLQAFNILVEAHDQAYNIKWNNHLLYTLMVNNYNKVLQLPEIVKAHPYSIVLIKDKYRTDELILIVSEEIPEYKWYILIPEIYDIRRRLSTKKAI